MEQIVLDTTAFYADPNRRRIAWRVLEALAEDGEIEVLVPEIVIRETVNHRRSHLTDLMGTRRKLEKQLAGFDIDVELPTINEQVIERYEADLRAAARLMGRVDPISQIDHDGLIDRAVGKRKPFNENGAGYRDALIWESVVGAAADGDVTFVTDNHRDFCASAELKDGYRQLHQDLVEHLESRGIDAGTVRVGSLDAIIAEYVDDPRSWLCERAGDEETRLLEAIEDRFEDVIHNAVANHLEDVWLDQGIEIMTTHNTDDVLLHEIRQIGELYVDEASYEPPDRLIGAVTVRADIVVDFSVEVWFDKEWHPLDRYTRPTSVNVRVTVELNETTDKLTITGIEGPFGGYIELNE